MAINRLAALLVATSVSGTVLTTFPAVPPAVADPGPSRQRDERAHARHPRVHAPAPAPRPEDRQAPRPAPAPNADPAPDSGSDSALGWEEARDAITGPPRDTGRQGRRNLRDRDLRHPGGRDTRDGRDRDLREDRAAKDPRLTTGRPRYSRTATCAYQVDEATPILEQPRRSAPLVGEMQKRTRSLGSCLPERNGRWTKILAPKERRIGYAKTRDLKNLGPAKFMTF